MFYYSENDAIFGTETLWTQDRHPGRRLPPLNKTLTLTPTLAPGEWWNDEHHVVGAVFSGDCRYLGILHELAYGRHLYTTIWEIEDKLNFNDIRQSQPWARRLQCLHTTHYKISGFSPYPLTIGPDGLFCTPGPFQTSG